MLAIKKYIEDTPVVSTEFISFDIKNIEKYMDLFNNFNDKGVIHKDSEFGHSTWILNDSVKNIGANFNLNEIEFKRIDKLAKSGISFGNFIVSIKVFCLYYLMGHDAKTARSALTLIKSLLNKTEFLTKNFLDEDLFEKNPYLWNVAYPLNSFLSFYDTFPYNADIVEEVYEQYRVMSSTFKESGVSNKYRRLLPLYNTIFKFNDIIEAFIQDSSGDERELYFPIILWWKITSIIPLRATEFSITQKNCLAQNDKGKWGIKLYRSTTKGNNKHSKLTIHDFKSKYELIWHPISKEIIDLINEYNELVGHYDNENDFYGDNSIGAIDRTYLLSARSYFKYNRNQASHNAFSYTFDYVDTDQFNKLIKRFMQDIVCNKYNISVVPKQRLYNSDSNSYYSNSLQMINMMDTRHFAIMNLVHLGYSPPTIQRIIGHDNINTSYSYYDHQEVFTDCYIVSIAKKKAFNKNSTFKNAILDISFESLFGTQGDGNIRYNMVKSKNTSGKKKYHKLDEGYCLYDKPDFLPCMIVRGNHRRCKFFAPNKSSLNAISTELESISDEISSEIKTLKYLTRHHKIIKEFENKYHATWNKLHSKELKKAEMISDYIINGIDMED
ncbi:hypothetical protein B2H97_00795 [Paraclostridium bifermentans]|uniref:hypothetical protein n=1 Tax=Paraclostridium bifermentans TaxID=1490 RepID=UPI000A1733A7|nr:hypothetical protein [Paraclostridium bifermentans]OSB11676.1 hypothetical protein B2H97_00795 [Paraclostridium bifermentans]